MLEHANDDSDAIGDAAYWSAESERALRAAAQSGHRVEILRKGVDRYSAFEGVLVGLVTFLFMVGFRLPWRKASRKFRTEYATAFGVRIWMPGKFRPGDPFHHVMLRHELVHVVQRARYGRVLYALMYLLPPAVWTFRARLETEAYEETVRAFWVAGMRRTAYDTACRLRELYRAPDYLWMGLFDRSWGPAGSVTNRLVSGQINAANSPLRKGIGYVCRGR